MRRHLGPVADPVLLEVHRLLLPGLRVVDDPARQPEHLGHQGLHVSGLLDVHSGDITKGTITYNGIELKGTDNSILVNDGGLADTDADAADGLRCRHAGRLTSPAAPARR